MLKEWTKNQQIHKVSFDTSMFHLQIHGLPLRLLNERNAFRIRNVVGCIHQGSSKLVTINCFLRLKIDIPISE